MIFRERFTRWLLGDLVYEVVQLLKRPEEWKCYMSTITHKTGITIWVGNSSYGVHISCTPTLSPDDTLLAPRTHVNIFLHERCWTRHADMLWGSVTMLSAVGFSIKHHVLWHYAKKVKDCGGRNT